MNSKTRIKQSHSQKKKNTFPNENVHNLATFALKTTFLWWSYSSQYQLLTIIPTNMFYLLETPFNLSPFRLWKNLHCGYYPGRGPNFHTIPAILKKVQDKRSTANPGWKKVDPQGKTEIQPEEIHCRKQKETLKILAQWVLSRQRYHSFKLFQLSSIFASHSGSAPKRTSGSPPPCWAKNVDWSQSYLVLTRQLVLCSFVKNDNVNG